MECFFQVFNSVLKPVATYVLDDVAFYEWDVVSHDEFCWLNLHRLVMIPSDLRVKTTHLGLGLLYLLLFLS